MQQIFNCDSHRTSKTTKYGLPGKMACLKCLAFNSDTFSCLDIILLNKKPSGLRFFTYFFCVIHDTCSSLIWVS